MLGAVDDIDYTGGQTLLELVEELQKQQIVVAIAEPSAAVQRDARHVRDHRARRAGADLPDAIEAARDAFRRRDVS